MSMSRRKRIIGLGVYSRDECNEWPWDLCWEESTANRRVVGDSKTMTGSFSPAGLKSRTKAVNWKDECW